MPDRKRPTIRVPVPIYEGAAFIVPTDLRTEEAERIVEMLRAFAVTSEADQEEADRG
jgi:hypothetical protein